jgi:hypothetical protein
MHHYHREKEFNKKRPVQGVEVRTLEDERRVDVSRLAVQHKQRDCPFFQGLA